MITVQQAYEQARAQLQTIYDNREAAAIAAVVAAYITGLDNTGRLIHKHEPLTTEQEALYNKIVAELLHQKPLQYILREAPFYGMSLYVDESVLIPRPETEELVSWIMQEAGLRLKVEGLKSDEQDTGNKKQETSNRIQIVSNKEQGKSNKRTNIQHSTSNIQHNILDVGTGSGCIPIALKKHLPFINMDAVDISEKALDVAKRNAAIEGTLIDFHLLNILDENSWKQLKQFDIIVSNPPYITQKEAAEMHNNVLQYEPHTALFVPNEEPLLFYEAIANFGLQHLNKNGLLFFEINEVYGKEIMQILAVKGYKNIELRKDMQGKDRMIKATLFG